MPNYLHRAGRSSLISLQAKGLTLSLIHISLCMWCMFAQVFPLFQETFADGTSRFPWATITTQYADGTITGIAAGTAVNADPTAMTVVSALALITNAIALLYIVQKSVKNKKNPYTGEVFTEFKYYKEAAARAVIK